MRGRAVVAYKSHKLGVVGPNPTSAIRGQNRGFDSGLMTESSLI